MLQATRDPNYLYPDEPHTCGCRACSEEIARLSGAPENGVPVTFSAGVTIAWTYWSLYFSDGTEALGVFAYYTGGVSDGSTVEVPWALQVSLRAEERRERGIVVHRCSCGSGTPCLRVTHTPLTLRYTGRSYREG